jgi:hypothetical protein
LTRAAQPVIKEIARAIAARSRSPADVKVRFIKKSFY